MYMYNTQVSHYLYTTQETVMEAGEDGGGWGGWWRLGGRWRLGRMVQAREDSRGWGGWWRLGRMVEAGEDG